MRVPLESILTSEGHSSTMEEKLLRKAMAVLVVLVLLFCSFSVYLFVIVPHREAVSISSVTLYETDLNYSVLKDKFSEPSFLENFTVTEINSNYVRLEIVPKSNPDVVMRLYKEQEGNLTLYTDGYMLTGVFGKMGNSQELRNEMVEEQAAVLEYIGQPAPIDDCGIDDSSIAGEPRYGLMLGFFGFAALIILLVFIMVFRQGWLLANLKLVGANIPLLFGVVSLYFAIGFGLMCAWATFTGTGPDETLICWALPAAELIVGTYLIVAETKALAQ
jgi:hypothetical protein